jgi:hypothetical protein
MYCRGALIIFSSPVCSLVERPYVSGWGGEQDSRLNYVSRAFIEVEELALMVFVGCLSDHALIPSHLGVIYTFSLLGVVGCSFAG